MSRFTRDPLLLTLSQAIQSGKFPSGGPADVPAAPGGLPDPRGLVHSGPGGLPNAPGGAPVFPMGPAGTPAGRPGGLIPGLPGGWPAGSPSMSAPGVPVLPAPTPVAGPYGGLSGGLHGMPVPTDAGLRARGKPTTAADYPGGLPGRPGEGGALGEMPASPPMTIPRTLNTLDEIAHEQKAMTPAPGPLPGRHVPHSYTAGKHGITELSGPMGNPIVGQRMLQPAGAEARIFGPSRRPARTVETRTREAGRRFR